MGAQQLLPPAVDAFMRGRSVNDCLLSLNTKTPTVLGLINFIMLNLNHNRNVLDRRLDGRVLDRLLQFLQVAQKELESGHGGDSGRDEAKYIATITSKVVHLVYLFDKKYLITREIKKGLRAVLSELYSHFTRRLVAGARPEAFSSFLWGVSRLNLLGLCDVSAEGVARCVSFAASERALRLMSPAGLATVYWALGELAGRKNGYLDRVADRDMRAITKKLSQGRLAVTELGRFFRGFRDLCQFDPARLNRVDRVAVITLFGMLMEVPLSKVDDIKVIFDALSALVGWILMHDDDFVISQEAADYVKNLIAECRYKRRGVDDRQLFATLHLLSRLAEKKPNLLRGVPAESYAKLLCEWVGRKSRSGEYCALVLRSAVKLKETDLGWFAKVSTMHLAQLLQGVVADLSSCATKTLSALLFLLADQEVRGAVTGLLTAENVREMVRSLSLRISECNKIDVSQLCAVLNTLSREHASLLDRLDGSVIPMLLSVRSHVSDVKIFSRAGLAAVRLFALRPAWLGEVTADMLSAYVAFFYDRREAAEPVSLIKTMSLLAQVAVLQPDLLSLFEAPLIAGLVSSVVAQASSLLPKDGMEMLSALASLGGSQPQLLELVSSDGVALIVSEYYSKTSSGGDQDTLDGLAIMLNAIARLLAFCPRVAEKSRGVCSAIWDRLRLAFDRLHGQGQSVCVRAYGRLAALSAPETTLITGDVAMFFQHLNHQRAVLLAGEVAGFVSGLDQLARHQPALCQTIDKKEFNSLLGWLAWGSVAWDAELKVSVFIMMAQLLHSNRSLEGVYVDAISVGRIMRRVISHAQSDADDAQRMLIGLASLHVRNDLLDGLSAVQFAGLVASFSSVMGERDARVQVNLLFAIARISRVKVKMGSCVKSEHLVALVDLVKNGLGGLEGGEAYQYARVLQALAWLAESQPRIVEAIGLDTVKFFVEKGFACADSLSVADKSRAFNALAVLDFHFTLELLDEGKCRTILLQSKSIGRLDDADSRSLLFMLQYLRLVRKVDISSVADTIAALEKVGFVSDVGSSKAQREVATALIKRFGNREVREESLLLGLFYVDFFVAGANLVIEVDGSKYHFQARDVLTDALLKAEGFTVVRVKESDGNHLTSLEVKLAAIQPATVPLFAPVGGEYTVFYGARSIAAKKKGRDPSMGGEHDRVVPRKRQFRAGR